MQGAAFKLYRPPFLDRVTACYQPVNVFRKNPHPMHDPRRGKRLSLRHTTLVYGKIVQCKMGKMYGVLVKRART